MFFWKKNKKRSDRTRFIGGKRETIKENRINPSKFFYWLALFSFFGVVVYSLFFSGFLGISKIVIRGAERTSGSEVKNEIESKISGNYLNFFPKNNIILLRKEALKILLAEHFKIIDEVAVKKEFPDTLIISIKEKTPLIILRNQGQEYVIDDLGIAYLVSDFNPELVRDLPILDDAGSNSIQAKSKALELDYIKFILEIRNKLKKDLDIETKLGLYTPSIASGDVTLKTTDGWKIFFNNQLSSVKEIEMLKVVIDKKIDKDKKRDLEYIDLRTDNKVYYKFKDSEQKTEN